MSTRFRAPCLIVSTAFIMLTVSSVSPARSQPQQPGWSFGSVGSELRDNLLTPEQPGSTPSNPPAATTFYFGLRLPQGASTQGWNLTWTQDVRANGSKLSAEVVHYPDIPELVYLPYRIDPCEVAGLDTPGTQIGLTYDFVFVASHPTTSFNPPPQKGRFTLTLSPDTVPPQFLSARASRTIVHRDETVAITLKASDQSKKLGGDVVWDSGLHLLRLEGPANPGNSGLQAHAIAQTVPQTCTEKVNETEHSFSYTVPHSAQPGDQITLRASVEDWVGLRNEQEVILKVVETKPDEDKRASDPGPFPPGPNCADRRGSIYYYQGIGGTCNGQLQVCGEVIPVHCPYAGNWTVAHSEKGPSVCCDDWKKARKTKKPCDLGVDADCDGVKNSDDNDPLRAGSPQRTGGSRL